MGNVHLRRGLVLLLLICFVPCLSGPVHAACAVDPEVSLAITKLGWVFNPETGNFQLEAEVRNISAWDVIDPGLAVSILDSAGKEFDSTVARSSVKRIRPKESASVKMKMQIARIPGSVRVFPFQGVAGT